MDETINSSMSFKDKRSFFEKEIAQQSSSHKPNQQRKFSFLQEHEVAVLKKEEAKKMSGLTQSNQEVGDIPDLGQTHSELESIISGVATSKTNRSATERLFGKNGLVKPPNIFTAGGPGTTHPQLLSNIPCDEI